MVLDVLLVVLHQAASADVQSLKPSILIGTSGQRAAFTKEVLEEMASINQVESVFANLSFNTCGVVFSWSRCCSLLDAVHAPMCFHSTGFCLLAEAYHIGSFKSNIQI